MDSMQTWMVEYTVQLKKGTIQQAYRGLMKYMLELKTHFARQSPDIDVSGGLYAGVMDMTYFALLTPDLKRRKLKLAVVYLHEQNRFEVWLSAVNKQVQQDYLNRIIKSGWQKYHLVPTVKGYDSIVEHVITDAPNFDDLKGLTMKIEQDTIRFLEDIEQLLKII